MREEKFNHRVFVDTLVSREVLGVQKNPSPWLSEASLKTIEDRREAKKVILTGSEENKEEVKDNYTRREFVYNSFSRSFRLPKSILEDKIKADYKDGVLSISLPKDEKATLTREISVN